MLQETAIEQKLWGTNSSGNIVPINITNGSKLLIEGRDVDQSINNVGAMSAALTGLPTVPTNTTVSCGLGTGTHGGDFEDKFSERAGFIWKLGKSLEPTEISFRHKKIIDQKISDLEKNNKKLKAKNDEIISQNKKLLARLKKLENIALDLKSSSKMISFDQKE